MAAFGRSQDAYDRLAAVVEVPMTVLAIVWLPVLVVLFVVHLSAGLTATFNFIDYLVWALFAVESAKGAR